jgi:arsenate reductase (thioredoxin)
MQSTGNVARLYPHPGPPEVRCWRSLSQHRGSQKPGEARTRCSVAFSPSFGVDGNRALGVRPIALGKGCYVSVTLRKRHAHQMADVQHIYNVLFLGTANSARSIMAEALLRRHGGDRFEVHSAGTEPRGVNPLTLRVLADAGIDASGARSKSVDEFLGQRFDYVITVCDQARQACPVFPGVHESLHWGYEDPADATGTEEERLAVFRRVLIAMGERVRQFAAIATRAAAESATAS